MSQNTSIIIEATIRSLGLSLTVALISGAVGIFMAWLIARTELSGRSLLGGLLSVPYALPPYLLGMAWVVLGNPRVGFLKDILPQSGAYGFWGMALVLSSVAFAFPYLELRAGFEKMDPALEEAARISGATPSRVFRDISFPLLWPPLVNGMCLAFLYSLAAFGVPALLGLPVRQFVLPTLIYSQLKVGGANGLQVGIQLSLILLGIAVVLLFFSGWLIRIHRKRSGAITGSKTSRPSLVKLGAWKPVFSTAAWVFFAVTVILPWIALALSALAPVAGNYSPSAWTMRHLSYIIALPDFREALINSTLLTLIVASGLVAAGFLLAFAAVRRNQRWAKVFIETMGIPFAAPGTVIAITLIFLATILGRMGIDMDYPLLLMGLAYALKYSAVGARSMVAAYHQVHPSLEEAARVSGAGTRELLWTIWLPILKKNWTSAWLLAALPIFTELTMSVLLTGPGAATLGTVLFQLQEYADQPSAAALAWMLLTLALFIGIITRRREST